MAVTTTAGDFGFTTQLSCILYEGTATISASGMDFTGATTGTIALSAGLVKGDWVAISTDTANTYSATGGLPVVTALANNVDLCIGRIIDQPRWVKIPSTTQSTWSTQLSGKYYRVATVEIFPMMIARATIVTNNAAAVTPGATGLLDIDASATAAAEGLSLVDVASGGSAHMFSFHYVGQETGGTYTILVGTTFFGTVTT